MNRKLISALFLLITVAACKKREILPVYERTGKKCTINGLNVLDVSIVCKQYPKNMDSVLVCFQNLLGRDIDSATVLIEMCSLPQNYDNCSDQFVKISKLKAGETSQLQLLYYGKHQELSSFDINVGLIKFDAFDHPFANKYTVNNFTSFNSSAHAYDTRARGYVFVDGSTTFRFKYPFDDTTYYNAYGNFGSQRSYTGKLFSQSKALISLLVLDTSKTVSLVNDTFNCSMTVAQPIGDSINAINLKLIKGL